MKKLPFIFLISGFLFFSCTNFLSENSDSSESSNNLSSATVAFRGTVEYSGAVPYELLELNNSESTSRSASYKIDSDWTYFATATSGSDSVSGTFGSETAARTFEISLATGKTWTITCGMKKGETVLLSDTFSVTTSVDEPAISHTFFVKPGTSGTGVIGLTMTVDSLMITHVTAECSDSVWNNSVTSNPCTTTSGTTSILVASIPSGTYEVTFNFYDSSNILQYTTTQSINVFDNLTTNRWYSTSYENSPIQSDGTFEVTTALINAQKRTVFYVGNTTVTGNDTTGTGSPYAPLATITKACSFMTDSSADYKIFIYGTVTGTQSVPSSLTGKAKSVIIQGFNGLENGVPKDSLDGNNGGTTLTISTSVPVMIKNLKITGGNAAENGGGISIASGSSVTILDNTQITSNTTAKSGGGIFNDGTLYLGGGVISKNTASEWGGGIFSNGTIFMYGSAVIGDMSKNVAATSSSCSNKAEIKAGGIYSSGNLYMGYSDESTERALTGGVCYNFSKDCGGIYQLNGSTSKVFKLNSGSVSYNAERGIYVAKCSFTMTGGSVSGNKATNNGQTNGAGVYAGYESDVVISGGTISSNTAGGNGGGIYLAQTDSSVTIEGGTISGNLASGNGKGIAVANGSLKMKGGAKLDSGNDVYLVSGKYITITGSLTGTVPVATITPASYSVGTTVLAAGTGVTLADEVGKFTLAPSTDGRLWYINSSDGKLKKYYGTKLAPDAEGDIVFNDGSATPYSSTLTLLDDEKAAAIAVIFHAWTRCSNNGENRILGVGLVQSSNGLIWCTTNADAYDIVVESTESAQDYSLWTGDRDGSDNFSQIAADDRVNDTDEESKYPAFYFAINYANQTNSHVSGTNYATGWYLPSICELYNLYSVKETVDNAITLCGGTALGTKSYWSSTMIQNDENNWVFSYDFKPDGWGAIADTKDDYSQYNPSYACAIREF